MVTKKQLLTAVVKFVKNEVIPHISDRSMKIVMSAVLYTIDAKPDIVTPFFTNPIIAQILQENDGEYDTELAFKVLDNIINEYGCIPITIPPIKFVMPTETTLKFYSGDVDMLKKYLMKELDNA